MQANDLNANPQSASLVAESAIEGNSDGEVNDALAHTIGSPLPLGEAMAVDATHINIRQSGSMTDDVLDEDDKEAAESVAFATSLLNELLGKISLANLESTLYVFRQVLEKSTPGQGLHSEALRGLIFASGLKYVCKKDEETMLDLIHLKELLENSNSVAAASNIVIEDDELRDMLMLGKAAWDELRGSISSATVNTIVYLLRQSLDEIPTHDERWPTVFAIFSDAIYLQFHHCEMSSDLMTAATMLKAAMEGSQERKLRHLAKIWILLTVTLWAAGEHSSGRTRNGSISRVPFDTPDRSAAIGALQLLLDGTRLLETVETNGNMDDLENGIAMLRLGLTGISLGDPEVYSSGLIALASGLHARFGYRGIPQDLDECISLHRKALDLLPSLHSLLSSSLNNFANALSTRFEQQGDPLDLEESMTLHRQALDLYPSPHPDRSMSLNNLA
ncbi:hypothetical protein CVT26_013542, partial [Gymnopilus dilepis]